MKHIKNINFTKLIVTLMSVLVAFSFCSCENEDNDISVESIMTESSEPEIFTLSVEEAVELVERDREVIEIFICNKLCGENYSPESVTLSPDSEYYLFSAVEDLLNSTYYASSGTKETFLAYPGIVYTSVSDSNGLTSVFRHPGSGYSDFIDVATVSVSDTESEKHKLITAKTVSGNEVTLSAVYNAGVWLLESSLLGVNSADAESFTNRFPYSERGSMSSLSGSVLVIELFVGDKHTGFTTDEESASHTKISKAMEYLSYECARMGGEIMVSYASGYFEHVGVVGTRTEDFEAVFKNTGFGNLKAFVEKNFAVNNYNSYVVAVNIDKEIKFGYNRFNSADVSLPNYSEYVWIGNKTTSEEICKAILYMSGAPSYTGSEYIPSLYRTYFPNDFLIEPNFESSVVTPVAAYACGITDELPPLYRVFYYE